MTYPIENNVVFVPAVPRLDALAERMAHAVIAGTYSSAREAARQNLVEYAGGETTDEKKMYDRIGNFTRKIRKTLKKLGYDEFGKSA